MTEWSKAEDELLITLRRANVPYREKVKIWAKNEDLPFRTQDSLRCHMNYLRNQDKLKEFEKEASIGVLDIETSDFKADIGYIISWAIYYPDENRTAYDVIKKRDITTLSLDKRICKSLVKELENVDLLVTYYGTRFDIPFMRTRCIMNGLDSPGYGEMRHIDCYYFARGKVATRRKSLKIISEALGLAGKTDVDVAVWMKAKLGDPDALAQVLEHNIADVEVTWNVLQGLQKYGKYTHKSI